jgi:hybrid cluster-associated redox disulfide protein
MAQKKEKKSRKITKEMTIAEILKKHPKAIFIFLDYGFHCIGCPAASK